MRWPGADMPSGAGASSTRTRLRREPARGVYDRAAIDEILDGALVCHLGFVDDGQPIVIPTLHARAGDELLVHGSSASRALRLAGAGAPVCVTVTLIDGLVLARSVFEHSVNYRSVVVLGEARLVEGPEEKLAALRALTEQLVPGRWADVRAPSRRELKATAVLSLPIEEASAKVRSGPPGDGDGPDREWPAWCGVIPLRTVAQAPVPDPGRAVDVPAPDYVRDYRRPGFVDGHR